MKKLKRVLYKYRYFISVLSIAGINPVINLASGSTITMHTVLTVVGFVLVLFGAFLEKVVRKTIKIAIIVVGLLFVLQGTIPYLIKI